MTPLLSNDRGVEQTVIAEVTKALAMPDFNAAVLRALAEEDIRRARIYFNGGGG